MNSIWKASLLALFRPHTHRGPQALASWAPLDVPGPLCLGLLSSLLLSTAKPTHGPDSSLPVLPTEKGFQGPGPPLPAVAIGEVNALATGTGWRLPQPRPTPSSPPLVSAGPRAGSTLHPPGSFCLPGPISNKVGSQAHAPRQKTDSPGHHEVTPGHRPCLLQRLFQEPGGSWLGEEARWGREGPGRNLGWKDPLVMPKKRRRWLPDPGMAWGHGPLSWVWVLRSQMG